jgi:hypothetical protein
MRNPPVVLLGPRWNINTPFSPVAPSTVPLPTSSVSGWGPNLYAGAGGAGRGGEQSSPEYALFNQPQGIAVDQQGLVLIADTNNNRIRRVARCSPPPAIVPRHCNQEPNAGPSSPSAPSVVSPPQGQPQSQKVLVPVPLAPAARAVLDNGCTNQSADFAWEFTWSGVPGAARYHLQVLGPTATVFLIDIPTIKGPSYRHYASRAHIAAPNLRGWKWKVRALIGSTWTDWSTEQTFDVEPPRVDCLG